MDPADAAFWLSLIFNFALSMAIAARFRRSVAEAELSEERAKSRFSWLCIAAGLFSGLVVFLGVVVLFRMNVGHGEVLIAGPIANFLLCCLSMVVGRVVIGWEPLKW